MIDTIQHVKAFVNGYVGGWPMIVFLMGTGLLLTILTGAVQFRRPGFALKEVPGKITQRGGGVGSVRSFQAVATALASTVGVGNIAGFGVPVATTGIGLVILTAVVILGGITSIARMTEWLVPFMAFLYLGGGLIVLVLYGGQLPRAIGLVFDGAFSGTAAAGGFAGSTIMMAMRYGIARGLFSNEAGLGSAPMVHAAADTDHPVRQGMYGIFEVFVYLGATGSLHLVWDVADTLNGLMALPNLPGVLVSIPLLLRLQKEFFSHPTRSRPGRPGRTAAGA